MKADETRLAALLEGQKQYVVPYFQRAYSWRRQQWDTLYADILELYEADARQAHFLGSVVLLTEAQTDHGPLSRLVIDGQQRLVTLSLFLAAMRDAAREIAPALAARIHTDFLVNDGAASPDLLKVVCSQQDQAAFTSVVLGESELPPSAIRDAYQVFTAALQERQARGFDLERLLHVVVQQLSFVAITLGAEDNPYRVFESLNAKGMPLTQGDLLRNYFFMRLPPAEHEHWFRTLWSPMQARLGDRFDDFMRDFFVKEGQVVRPEEVYQGWRKRLAPMSEDEIRAVLRELGDWSVEYDRLLHPQRETDPAMRQRFERLTTWSATLPTSLHPFLLRLRADHTRELLPADQVTSILRDVESYLVRRRFVGPPAVNEYQLLIGLYTQVAGQPDVAARFTESLARPQTGWPSDAEFSAAVVRYPLFIASHPDQRKLILVGLEESYPHRWPVNYKDFDLELIAPLLPREDWRAELGVTEAEHYRLVGTLGNFTWMEHGRAPSLRVPERKRELLRLTRYGLELVRDFATAEQWTAEALVARSQRLAERALTVWPRPSD